MNILFTCAGRRNYLINYFKQALNSNGKVIAVDMQLSAPALVEANVAQKVPSIDDGEYISTIERIIQEEKVNAIISLNDFELPILAQNKKRLEKTGARLLISPANVIDICFDKWKTYHFLLENEIKTPKTYISLESAKEALYKKDIQLPLVVKPRWGSASIGIDIVYTEEELELSFRLQHLKVSRSIPKDISAPDAKNCIVIQEKIHGEEYGVDILNNLDGEYHGTFVRKKLAMRSGETDKAISVIDERFNTIAKKVSHATKHVGNMDCDFFIANGEVYFLEMNPRFGGGYPFSHEAGINTPALYIAWLNNETGLDQYNQFKPGMAFSKCDRILKIPKETTIK
ncbi:ATP-grasp domain-containing protein [Flagellimonas nanhaiensis]|uniref:ATP-grasp domain-containing protein n=1 Tax=Flagellimonas nanhaiensis TaxID=2292706 RepID=A0A371JKT1_9FLAO|nr:ATP-grasp domain-containing protein [Allomuricauda nanhaiensis]RDY57577.1 ATP-grasp domain-containing protein [Allomuricauda nanhaiensis]